MPWTVSYHPAALDEANDQPTDIRARLERLTEVIEERGPDLLPPKTVSHLRDGIWELRLKGKDGISRALYVTRREQQLIIVRIFTKKTQKTPPREIKLALARAEEV